MKLSVVVPTYRRAADLEGCLAGLRQQTRPPDEVLVVTQVGDDETSELLAHFSDWPALRPILQTGKGAVRQYNAGLAASRGDIVAITDDDAVPRPDWLQRIEQHFLASTDLGGVGGRDYVQENGALLKGDARLVGVVQWFGRVVGNHHIATRPHDDVHILKGVNMAFRSAAIADVRFDQELKGTGAQTSLDMAFSFDVHARGWRLLFDPAVAVDHYPGRRFDPNQRAVPSPQAVEDSAYNFYLTLRRHLKRGWRREMALFWAYWVGIERIPGAVRGVLSRLKGDRQGVEMRAAAKRAWQTTRAIRSALA